jgi:hypothetical protein
MLNEYSFSALVINKRPFHRAIDSHRYFGRFSAVLIG